MSLQSTLGCELIWLDWKVEAESVFVGWVQLQYLDDDLSGLLGIQMMCASSPILDLVLKNVLLVLHHFHRFSMSNVPPDRWSMCLRGEQLAMFSVKRLAWNRSKSSTRLSDKEPIKLKDPRSAFDSPCFQTSNRKGQKPWRFPLSKYEF